MVIAAPALNFKPKQATLPVKSFLQRLLLVTDGKVADIVEAYSGEAVEAVKLHQNLTTSNSLLDEIKLKWKREIIKSSIVLQGKNTKTNYLQVNSYLILENLNPEIRNKFICNNQPINELLEENKVETHKEIIDCGIELAGNLAQCFDVEPETEIIYRTYLILTDSLPTIQVIESFPTSHFVD